MNHEYAEFLKKINIKNAEGVASMTSQVIPQMHAILMQLKENPDNHQNIYQLLGMLLFCVEDQHMVLKTIISNLKE